MQPTTPTLTTTLKVRTRTVYGNDLVYLTDPAQAEAFTLLTGRKTITPRDAQALQTLAGLELEWQR